MEGNVPDDRDGEFDEKEGKFTCNWNGNGCK